MRRSNSKNSEGPRGCRATQKQKEMPLPRGSSMLRALQDATEMTDALTETRSRRQPNRWREHKKYSSNPQLQRDRKLILEDSAHFGSKRQGRHIARQKSSSPGKRQVGEDVLHCKTILCTIESLHSTRLEMTRIHTQIKDIKTCQNRKHVAQRDQTCIQTQQNVPESIKTPCN